METAPIRHPRLGWRRAALMILTVPALLYCALLGVLYAAQGRLLFHPMDRAPDVSAAGVPGLRTVTVTTADGLRLLAWFLPPPDGQPLVLYLHGNGGHIGNRISRARRIAARGWGLMMLEYRGYGDNPGTPGEHGMALDAEGALNWLAAADVPPGRVVLYGESLGTGVAVGLAASRPAASPVAAVVLDSPYTSITDMARLEYPWVPVRLLLRHTFDTLGRIGRIHAPLLVMQGDRDFGIPPAMGRAVFEAAQAPRHLWVSLGGLHENVFETGGEQEMAAFLARHRLNGGAQAAQSPSR